MNRISIVLFVQLFFLRQVLSQTLACASNAGFCFAFNATNYLNCYINNNDDPSSITVLLKNCTRDNTLVNTLNVFKNYKSTGKDAGDLLIEIDLGPTIQNLFLENNFDNDYIRLRSVRAPELTYLRFSYVQGRFFLESREFFNNLPSLKTISSSFAGSYIFSEETPTFSNLKNLTNLELQLYVLNDKTLTEDMVSGLDKLENLDLTNSNLEKIAPNALRGLLSLKSLSLHNNNIEELDDGVFSDLNQLDYLNLEGNDIKIASKRAFNGLSNVTILDLSRNPEFPLENLLAVMSVEKLYLENNGYTFLGSEIFQQLLNLEILYLNDPFNCQCNLQWASTVSMYGISVRGALCDQPILSVGLYITSTEAYGECLLIVTSECFNRSSICPGDKVCENTVGGSRCVCQNGYRENGIGFCDELNECIEDNGGCMHFCSNTEGSYDCLCRDGYEVNGKECVEINPPIPPPFYCSSIFFIWAILVTVILVIFGFFCFPFILTLCLHQKKKKETKKRITKAVLVATAHKENGNFELSIVEQLEITEVDTQGSFRDKGYQQLEKDDKFEKTSL